LAMICTLLVVLFHAQSFFITLTGIILSGNYEHFNRHFSTKMRNLILNSFYQSFLSLSSMAFECIYFSDAIIRSAYRILFSKKKTLEWQVYSPFAKSKFPILFYLPSLIFSVLFLLFFQNQLTVFLAASWLVFPLISIQISKPYAEKKGWTEKEKDLFRKMARKEFRFFEECVGKSTHHLPPDNIQLEPIEKIAMRTSPTNIGLYLASLASARDFEFITTQILCQKVKKTLETLSKLERFHGHLYNWYDLNTLNVIGDRFVSTVDSGNYVAGLVVLRQALKEYESEDSQIREIIDQLDEEIGRTNFAVLFHHERNLFRVGVVPDEVQKSSSDYDHYMSEARITSFLAIAMGQVSATHWRHLSRPLLSFYGRVGVGSWSGTGFEYFMAPLFLPVIENSLEDESLEYACFCQKKVKGCFNEKDHVFGISESGYALTDHNGNYQYKAFGVPFLSIQGKEEIPKVISPYTSFLMLERKDRAILRNLELLEKNGLCGVYGFFESCEFHSNFSGDFTPVYSYMSHHKGMSILALAGAVFDKKNVDRFLSFCDFSAKVELLAERFPIEAKIAKKRKIYRENSLRQNFPPQLQTVTKHPETGCLLTDGKMTLLFYNNGQNRVLYQEMDLFDYQKGGIFCTVYLGEEAYLFSYEKNSEQKVLFGNDFVEHSITRGKKSVHLRFELISGKNAFLVRLEVHGHFGKSRVEFYFDATLQYEKEYRAHPAFQSLSLEGKSDGKSLVIRRRGVEEHRYLSVESPFPFQTKLSEREAEKVFGYQMLYRPEVLLNFDFERSENICLPLIFSYSQKEKGEDLYQYLDGSFLLTDKLKKIGQERMRRLEEICCYDDDCREAEKNFLPKLLQKRRFLVGNHVKMIPRDALWKYGISGDDPIISFYFDAKNEEQFKTIKIFIRIFKKLRISGLCIDLVILHPGSEEYFDPVREKLTDLISQYRCEFLLGKHPGIHFVPQTSVEDLSFFDSQSIWTLFFPGKSYPTLQNEEIPHIKVEDQNSNALPQCMVGTLLERGFLINKKEFTPQVPFSHIVSNRMVGFVCNQNSLGFTWFRSSGLFRLSKWENLPEEKDGEKLYLLFENEAYDLLIQAEKVTYQNQFAIFQGKIGTESYKITATVSEFLSSKLIFVELSDALAKNSKLVYSFVPALGKNADRNIIFQAEDRFITMLGCRMDDITAGGFVFSDRPREAVASFDDRLNLTVLSGKETSFLLGGFSTQDHLNFLKRKICDLDLEEILSLEHDFYNAVFPAEVSREEFWISYQAIFSRFFGRTGLYQSSGAYGFRDQLQDSLVFLDHLPKKTKEHILRCAAHQFEEGDVLHWWHTTYSETKTSSGIRSRCSDDYLWLLFAVSEYLSTTGDREILTLPVPFLKGETLKDGEDERYFLPEKGSTAPLLEHLKRCVLLFIRRGLGINALPFIGCGDWNDGMNRIDGESVWLGFFGAICLHRTRDLFDDMTQKSIDSFLERLSKGLSSSHNGIWFVRAIREGGEVLGNCVSLEKECSIDLITQAFSAFYYLEFQNSTLELSEKCVKSALMASFEILFDEKHRILPLFTRPFQNTTPSPGYIQRYCAGVRENGGQYTHAAVWFCLALLEFGSQTKDDELMKAAKRVYEIINPFENIKLENFKRYQREPYVLCGDVYSADGFRGHGGWSWYTGAAAWYTRLMKRFRDLTKS